MDRVRDIFLYFVAALAMFALLCAVYQAMNDKIFSATALGTIFLVCALIVFIPQLEVLKAYGVEARLRQNLDRAEEIIGRLRRLENLNLDPPPTKFLIPFLDKASLEDNDEGLQSRWAELLLSASTHYEARQLTFIDILTRLSSQELTLLEDVCLSQKDFPEATYPDGHLTENEQNARALCSAFRKERMTNLGLRKTFDDHVAAHPLRYGRVMHAHVYNEGQYLWLYTEYGVAGNPKYQSVEILEHEKLVAFNSVEVPGTGVKIRYFDVTFLGIAFVTNCSPRAKDAVKKYQEEFQKRVVPATVIHEGSAR